MKPPGFLLLLCPIFLSMISVGQPKGENFKRNDSLHAAVLTEGILHTRVSFPGNILNELLSKIDFKNGDPKEQLRKLQATVSTSEYSEKVSTQLKKMTADEQAAMGSMMMGIMLSPIYARISCSANQVVAKAYALNYSLESYMNISGGIGKMVVLSNDKSKDAAINFSAANMRKVWEKDEIDSERYQVQMLDDREIVAGYDCKKVTYTYKQQTAQNISTIGRPAYKLIVWYTPRISANINFLHPFYFPLNQGILKIEVHYDKKGTNKMLYETIHVEARTPTANDFHMSNKEPEINWDNHPAQASMNIISAMLGSMGEKE